MSSIKKNFAYNSFLMVSNYIINLILFPYCARVLGVERFGTINFTQNIVQYFLFIAMMGITHMGVREIAKQEGQEERNQCFSSLLMLNIIYTLISLIIFVPLIFCVNRFADIRALMLLGAVLIFFNTFTVEWYFRGIEDFKYITIRNLAIKVLYVISVFCFVHTPDDYILFFALTVGMTVLSAVVNYLYACKTVSFTFSNINIKKYLGSSLSLGVYSILTSMYTTFNVAFLGFVWDDIQVGYYTTALKLYTVVLGFYSAFTSVMLPRMTSIGNNGDAASFQRMISKSLELLFTFAIPLVIVLFILAPEIITLLAGPEYHPSILMSRIVVPMLFVVGVAQVMSFQILIPKGEDKTILYASVIGAVVGIISNIVLTRYYSAVGTCITVVITESIVTSFYVWIVRQKKYITLNVRSLLRYFIISLPYIVLCGVPHLLLGNKSVLSLITSFVFCTIYFLYVQYHWLQNEYVVGIISKILKKQ